MFVFLFVVIFKTWHYIIIYLHKRSSQSARDNHETVKRTNKTRSNHLFVRSFVNYKSNNNKKKNSNRKDLIEFVFITKMNLANRNRANDDWISHVNLVNCHCDCDCDSTITHSQWKSAPLVTCLSHSRLLNVHRMIKSFLRAQTHIEVNWWRWWPASPSQTPDPTWCTPTPILTTNKHTLAFCLIKNEEFKGRRFC